MTMMPLITSVAPDRWQDLEDLITNILNECGMTAERNKKVKMPRGAANIDVFASEEIDSIRSTVICECKNWAVPVPREVIFGFRMRMQEIGANRGYVISRAGFQAGAKEAVVSTPVQLVTFEEFQVIYFSRWYKHQTRALEDAVAPMHSYYGPTGPAGYGDLRSNAERARYDEVWDRYHFAGMLLVMYSPYTSAFGGIPAPVLPFDFSRMEAGGIFVPEAVKVISGHREMMAYLRMISVEAVAALRLVNPLTRKAAAR